MWTALLLRIVVVGELDVVYKVSCWRFLATPSRPDPDGQRHDFCDKWFFSSCRQIIVPSLLQLVFLWPDLTHCNCKMNFSLKSNPGGASGLLKCLIKVQKKPSFVPHPDDLEPRLLPDHHLRRRFPDTASTQHQPQRFYVGIVTSNSK